MFEYGKQQYNELSLKVGEIISDVKQVGKCVHESHLVPCFEVSDGVISFC